MCVLDTDMLSHLFQRHPKVMDQVARATRGVCSTVISRIEALQGRFASILKAEDGEKLALAHQRLSQTEAALEGVVLLPIDAAAAAQFDRLLTVKGLRRIGRGDLLIAAIALANRATLVTRNTKDYERVPGLPPENWAD